MIQFPVDPRLDDPLDIGEVADHVTAVERARPHFDLSQRIVPVRMLADTVVVEQAVSVTEVDVFGDGIHLVIWESDNLVIDCSNQLMVAD